jgi:hypothetical protein
MLGTLLLTGTTRIAAHIRLPAYSASAKGIYFSVQKRLA